MNRRTTWPHQVQCPHTTQVLDFLKGLYSINNTFSLFTHVLLANANVLSEVEKDFNLSSMACVTQSSVY